MKATLIYNTNAGGKTKYTPELLQDALKEAGYRPVYRATSSEKDLDGILNEDLDGLVVAAGGDGTVRAVATRLLDRENVPLAILPMGTANNLCRSLGVEGSILEIIDGLKNPRKFMYDVGYVQAPWGEDYFLEGAGFGFFADVLATYDPDQGKSIFRGIVTLAETLSTYATYAPLVRVDDEVIVGNFLLVEVLNTKAVGPRLQFAPQADPGDGLFEVVRVYERHEEGFLTYMRHMLTENLDELTSYEVSQGRKLEIEWTGFRFHIDGEVRPSTNKRPPDYTPASGIRPLLRGASKSTLLIEILPQVLELWLPQAKVKEQVDV
jgi:diacylglycerol kinase family enzyme